ncbi:MAG: hypothetical protein L0H25_04070 [Micrococcales bacterium]|nr:hypothetical protein [Micrococcales bacterium]
MTVPAGDVPTPLLLIFGLAFVVRSVVALLRLRRPTHLSGSQQWFEVAVRLGALIFGAILCLLALAPERSLAIVVAGWLLLLPVLMAAVGVLRWVTETREGRRISDGVGMPPLRRRLAWGWVAAAWFVLSPIAIVAVVALIAMARPDLIDLGWQRLSAICVVSAVAGATLAGLVQAARRRAQERRSQRTDRAP